MPRIGVSITKSTSFRNSTQEFTNVYYYEASGSLPTQGEADSFIDALKSIEVGFHSTAVTFVRGRLWSQGGSPATNDMISQKNLSGTGSNTTNTSLDKERAFLFRLRAGTDSRGKNVYLRKWYHSCGSGPGNVAPSTSALQNVAGFTGTDKTNMQSAVGGLTSLTVAGTSWGICAKSGRQPSSGATWQSHDFLEHHQLGDMWRAA